MKLYQETVKCQISNVRGQLQREAPGFSIIEVILSVALFALVITFSITAFLHGLEATHVSGERTRAFLLAEEGIEATRNIRDSGWDNLTTGTHGLIVEDNIYKFSGEYDEPFEGFFKRSITVGSEQTHNSTTYKEVEVEITWQQTETREGSVAVITRFTNWKE